MEKFRDALRQKDFVITAELPLQPADTAASVERAAKLFAPHVDALQLIDDREACGNMSAVVAASLLIRAGADAVLHMTCRDRNRVALRSDLLGAAATGVTSLVISRGEKLPRHDRIRGKGVFDTDEHRLMQIARRIGDDASLVGPPGFLLGTYVSIFDAPADWKAQRIEASIENGSRLLQTQPCLNERLLSQYASCIVRQRITHKASLVVEVPLLASAEEAQALKAREPSALIPPEVIRRIGEARDPAQEGIEICAGMLSTLQQTPGVSGANVRHSGRLDAVIAAIEMARLRGRE